MALSACNTTVDIHGRELVEHGTTFFPVAVYHDDITNAPVPWHWHDELEAGIVVHGQVIVAAGTEKYILKAGDGFFINSEVLHAVWNDGSPYCRLHSMCFHPRLVGGGLDSVFWQNYLKPLMSDTSLKGLALYSDDPWSKNLSAFIDNTWRYVVKEEPGYEFEVRNELSKLVFQLVKNRRNTPASPSEKALRDSARIKMMLQFIHDHYPEELTTENISQSASISISEALRCFKGTIGITPIQYVKQYRIQKAAELLSSTSLKVADIGTLCGFQEMSYFAKTFREMKGMTPSAFREKQRD